MNNKENMEVMTFTFGDMSENSVGMEQIGELGSIGSGFNREDLKEIMEKFEGVGGVCELIKLNDLIKDEEDGKESDEAYLLVLRKGINIMMGDEEYDKKMFEEYRNLDWDKKCLMRGRVVNKLARWNLCFSDYEQNSDYENGKGRVYDVNKLKYGNFRGDKMVEFLGEKSKNLEMEGNYYYDKEKCGIGYHGDTERRRVIGLRLGGTMNFRYKWWKDGMDRGEEMEIFLDSGDMYIMSEKSVGNDWRKRKIWTLRHSVGKGRFVKKNSDSVGVKKEVVKKEEVVKKVVVNEKRLEEIEERLRKIEEREEEIRRREENLKRREEKLIELLEMYKRKSK